MAFGAKRLNKKERAGVNVSIILPPTLIYKPQTESN